MNTKAIAVACGAFVIGATCGVVASPAWAQDAQASPGLGKGALQRGVASWYGSGHRTANGERFNPNGLTAAHRTLPFGTRLRVVNQKTGRSVVVRINDRGPFVGNRVIDLSRGSARALGVQGVANVSLHRM